MNWFTRLIFHDYEGMQEKSRSNQTAWLESLTRAAHSILEKLLDHLSRRLQIETETDYRDPVFTRKELAHLREVFYSHCIKEDGIYYWDKNALTTFLESRIPNSAKAKLQTCFQTIWNSFLFLSNYPFSPYENTLLDYDDFVRTCAFLTGRAEIVYHAPHVDGSTRWTAQYSRPPSTILSDAIFKSISSTSVKPDVEDESYVEIVPPRDEDVFEVLATLQPVYDRNSIPHYKSVLWVFSHELSSGRVERGTLRVARQTLLDLLDFFQSGLPEHKDIGAMIGRLEVVGDDDESLLGDELGVDVLGEEVLVGYATGLRTGLTMCRFLFRGDLRLSSPALSFLTYATGLVDAFVLENSIFSPFEHEQPISKTYPGTNNIGNDY